jgi:hypothetical protein
MEKGSTATQQAMCMRAIMNSILRVVWEVCTLLMGTSILECGFEMNSAGRADTYSTKKKH